MIKKLNLSEIYQQDASGLLGALKKGKMLHSSGDIAASGDEFEVPIRDFLTKRLPPRYKIGHGHIVDKNWNASSQFDIIIVDSDAAPVLFKGAQGVEYYPWESVYAIGEVKSSYKKSEHQIHAFVKKIDELKKGLSRKDVPPSYIGDGIHLGKGFSSGRRDKVLNPLLTFMVFGRTGQMKRADLMTIYSALDAYHLPDMLWSLDGDFISKGEISYPSVKDGAITVDSVALNPSAANTIENSAWIKYSLDSKQLGQVLAMFLMGMFSHLNATRLYDPSLTDYLSSMLKAVNADPQVLSAKVFVEMADKFPVSPENPVITQLRGLLSGKICDL